MKIVFVNKMWDSSDNFNKKDEKHTKKDSAKENKTRNRHERTKKEQFDLIVDFYKQNNEELVDADIFSDRWNELVVNLNHIGPPSHTIGEWKRIWTEHKYNKKRKRMDAEGKSSPPPKNFVLDYQTVPEEISDHIVSGNDENGLSSLSTNHVSNILLTDPLAQNVCIPSSVNVEFSTQESLLTLDNLNEFLTEIDVLSSSEKSTDAVNEALYTVPLSYINDGSIQSGSFSEQQNRLLHLTDFQNANANVLSEIVKKLDILIALIVESNNLKKELLKKNDFVS